MSLNLPTSRRISNKFPTIETAPLPALNFASLTKEWVRREGGRSVSPCEALVPYKVVEHGDFNRDTCGQQIIEFQPGTKDRKRG